MCHQPRTTVPLTPFAFPAFPSPLQCQVVVRLGGMGPTWPLPSLKLRGGERTVSGDSDDSLPGLAPTS